MSGTGTSNIVTDVVVIGSGIGGLSCAALLARYGFDVVVCESYSAPGVLPTVLSDMAFTSILVPHCIPAFPTGLLQIRSDTC